MGILSGKTIDRLGVTMYFVHFPDSPTWLRENALEIIDDGMDDAFSMLAKRQFGRLTDYRRNLTSIQLSGKLANLIYSMNTTNTEFYAYQYKPLLAFLDSPSKGILIVDEVGLGKTIYAGLIWTELRATPATHLFKRFGVFKKLFISRVDIHSNFLIITNSTSG